MHQNASLKSLIPIGSRWLPLFPFPLLFVPAHRQLQEEAPPARRAACFSLVSQNLSWCALQIGTYWRQPQQPQGCCHNVQRSVCCWLLSGRFAPPGLDTWMHQAGENAGVLMDCTGRDQQLANGIHADVFRALWMGEVGEQFMMIYAFWNIWTNNFSAGMEHWVNILLPEPLLHWVALAIRSIAAMACQGTSMVTDDPCWYTLVHIGTPYGCWLGVLSLPMSKPQSLSFRSAGQPSRFISL